MVCYHQRPDVVASACLAQRLVPQCTRFRFEPGVGLEIKTFGPSKGYDGRRDVHCLCSVTSAKHRGDTLTFVKLVGDPACFFSALRPRLVVNDEAMQVWQSLVSVLCIQCCECHRIDASTDSKAHGHRFPIALHGGRQNPSQGSQEFILPDCTFMLHICSLSMRKS